MVAPGAQQDMLAAAFNTWVHEPCFMSPVMSAMRSSRGAPT